MNAFIIYFLYLKYHFKYVVSLKCLLQLKFNVSIFFTTLCTLLVNLKKKRDFFLPNLEQHKKSLLTKLKHIQHTTLT